MSESFELAINSKSRPYVVHIGSGMLKELEQDSDCVRIIDESLIKHYPWLAHPKNIAITAQEKFKTVNCASTIIEKMRFLGARRDTKILAIGGGIIQDLSTFAASSYMRGVDWDYYPTTLLGMVDSCIGGKSSLNVGKFKNIAGNFYPPQKIIINPVFCKTLGKPQLVEGLFESLKICFAGTTDQIDQYSGLSLKNNLQAQDDSLTDLILLSLKTKKHFIETDEFDQGIRLTLNFGHTFGHAIESASKYAISHGIAVGIGMLMAIHVSAILLNISTTNKRFISLEESLLKLLNEVPDLNALFSKVSRRQFLTHFKSDKKHSADAYVMILINSAGFLERVKAPMSEDTEKIILSAFDRIKKDIYEIQ
jgi:3-dehydroquinate synthase